MFPDLSVSLRYHDVYGHNEMNNPSMIYKWLNGDSHELCEGDNNVLRDFIHISDVTDVNVMLFEHFQKHNQFPFNYSDVGTGRSVSLKKVGEEIAKHTKGEIKYVERKNTIQQYTEADIKELKKAYKEIYKKDFEPLSIEKGIEKTKNDYLYHQSIKLHHLW